MNRHNKLSFFQRYKQKYFNYFLLPSTCKIDNQSSRFNFLNSSQQSDDLYSKSPLYFILSNHLFIDLHFQIKKKTFPWNRYPSEPSTLSPAFPFSTFLSRFRENPFPGPGQVRGWLSLGEVVLPRVGITMAIISREVNG